LSENGGKQQKAFATGMLFSAVTTYRYAQTVLAGGKFLLAGRQLRTGLGRPAFSMRLEWTD
jgi:hypothetical protein